MLLSSPNETFTPSTQRMKLWIKPNNAEPSPSRSSKSIISQLQHLFAELALSIKPSCSPTDFARECIPPWFAPGSQQDCAEYLRFLLDQMQSEWLAIASRKNVEEIHAVSSSMSKEEMLQTFPLDIFGGLLINRYHCKNCNNVRRIPEHVTEIPLAFPETVLSMPQHQEIELDYLLDYFLSSEALVGSNAYNCEVCQSLVEGERSTRIKHAPNNLILSIKRFSVVNSAKNGAAAKLERRKILNTVRFPELLCIPARAFEGSNDENKDQRSIIEDKYYQLYAVVSHSGTSSDSGHYYCHAVVHHDGEKDGHSTSTRAWFEFNDSQVTPSNWDGISTISKRFKYDTPYMLFYHCVSPSLTAEMMPDHGNINSARIPAMETNGWPRLLVQEVMDENLQFLEQLEKDQSGYQTTLLQKEKERKEREARFASASSIHRFNQYKDHDDDYDDHGSGFGGGNDMFTRYIC